MVRVFFLLVVLIGIAWGPATAQQYPAASDAESATYAEPKSRSYRDSYRVDRSSLGHRYDPQYVSLGEYRQPTSLVLFDTQRALIATKRTGEIYQFDLQNHSVGVAISAPNREFQQVIKLGDEQIAVADTRNNQVVVFRIDEASGRWIELESVELPGRPNSLCYDSVHSQLFVSSVWGQRLFRFQVSADTASILTRIQSIDLPMCGGQVLCLPKQGLVLVGDAFGCDFVVIDRAKGAIANHGQLHEHNICQWLALDDGDAVLFPQQLLIDLVPAVQGQITWGNFLSNNLRSMQTIRLAESSGVDIYSGSKFFPIGAFGNGAADPTSIAMTRHGKLAVTIGGMNQVAFGSFGDNRFHFVDVGFHPVDCEFTEDEKTLVVVNQFSDSVSLIDAETLVTKHIALGDLRRPSDVERGEQLFHDSRLSHDGWMSCQSCHSGGHTNGLLTDNFTDQSYHSPKRVLSLLGQAETSPYGWAGLMPTLEEQIAFSIQSTMASDDEVRQQDVDLLAKYVRSLERPPSLVDARSDVSAGNVHAKQIRRGRKFFNSAGCVDCHSGPHYTSRETYDVGVQDENKMREFNPPSLIALSQRQNSLFHDGRAKSIHDVVFKENHQMPDDANDRQREDLIQFLMSL